MLDNSFGRLWRQVYQSRFNKEKDVIVDTDLENKILITHAKTRSPFKTASICETELQVVFDVLKKNSATGGVAIERHGGNGRPELAPFTVARRRANETGWNNEDKDIAKARAEYAAGRVELATGRDGAWLILYAFPRRRVAKGREDCFKCEVQ